MAKVTIDDNILFNIGDAIRDKLDGSTLYKPSQMASAIESIETGYPEPTGSISITANGSHNVKNYETANVNVSNSYSAEDEGKVVDDGVLVAQGSQTITENGTYDTTLISELIANVSGGGGGGSDGSFIDPKHIDVDTDSVFASILGGYWQFNASQAFGTEKKHWWGANNKAQHWLKIVFEEAITINKIQFSNYWTSGSSTWFSTNVIFQGSNDDSTWIDLFTVSDLSQSEDQRTYEFNNNTSYLYYRFLCNNTGATLFYTGLGKIRLYGKGSGGTKNILSGTDAPTASLGSEGDVYLQYLSAGIKNSYNQYINTGYSANTNSKLVCDFLVTEAQTSEYPTVFGARPNVGNTTSAISWHMAKNSRDYSGALAAWQNQVSINGVGATALIGKVAHAELQNGLFKLTADEINVEQALTQVSIVSSTPIFLFQMGVSGSASNFGQTNGIIIFNFKIYENNVLIHDFVPAKDTNDIVCLYDEIAQEYKYPSSGTMEYIEEGTIQATYCKVNGAWQDLIGSNIDDVNTGA